MFEARITASAPVLLVKDVVKAAAYYRDKLGFNEPESFGDPPNFSMVNRDGFTVMLAQVDSAHTIVPHWKIVHNMWNVYFWVDDVEAIYAELQKRGAIIDYTLYTTPWGTREFGVQDLDDHDIAFGQVLKP
jgi:uncharacterized glyoxalase superfamily protein PhnB